MPNISGPEVTHSTAGWRTTPERPSLSEVHRSLVVPPSASFFRKLLAFAGPGFLVAVGYMDPGNWATDLAGGSKYNYSLLSVIMMSNLMAILLQALSLKLGIATGRDLAQACRDHYSKPVSFFLWVICEIAIAACDLAEVIGSAIALNLLFGLPLLAGVCITSLDVLFVLFLQNKGFRYIEALVITLIVIIGGCFAWEIVASHPNFLGIAKGFIPSPQIVADSGMLYIAIGILGATVMPHNLYLHSSIVQTRRYELSAAGKREAIKFATIDSTVALMFALFINAAILIVAAATFTRAGATTSPKSRTPIKVTHAASRRDRRQRALCHRPSGLGSKLHAHRHPGRPDRDGRFPEHSSASVAAPSHHPAHRDHSRGRRHDHLRRKRTTDPPSPAR